MRAGAADRGRAATPTRCWPRWSPPAQTVAVAESLTGGLLAAALIEPCRGERGVPRRPGRLRHRAQGDAGRRTGAAAGRGGAGRPGRRRRAGRRGPGPRSAPTAGWRPPGWPARTRRTASRSGTVYVALAGPGGGTRPAARACPATAPRSARQPWPRPWPSCWPRCGRRSAECRRDYSVSLLGVQASRGQAAVRSERYGDDTNDDDGRGAPMILLRRLLGDVLRGRGCASDAPCARCPPRPGSAWATCPRSSAGRRKPPPSCWPRSARRST